MLKFNKFFIIKMLAFFSFSLLSMEYTSIEENIYTQKDPFRIDITNNNTLMKNIEQLYKLWKDMKNSTSEVNPYIKNMLNNGFVYLTESYFTDNYCFYQLLRENYVDFAYFVNKSQIDLSDTRIEVKKHPIIDGYGAFANQDIESDEVIGEYVGEIIKEENSYRDNTYIFELANESLLKHLNKDANCKEIFIDAKYQGNKTRFINHSNDNNIKQNHVLKIIIKDEKPVSLEFSIVFLAEKKITKGDELLYPYSTNKELLNKVFNEVKLLHPNKNFCQFCDKSSENIKQCSACKKVKYCSVECQRNDWKKHKNNCKKSN